jgi:hypothetical protein
MPTEKIEAAVSRTMGVIEKEMDPSKMTQQEGRDYLDALFDRLEPTYGAICTDLDGDES